MQVLDYGLRIVVALTGVSVFVLGLNVGFGGIQTLGWQVSPDFITIMDDQAFIIQDSHIRFVGGFWLASGLVYLIAALRPGSLLQAFQAMAALSLFGGLVRFFGDPGLVMTNSNLLNSFLAEILLFPALAFFMTKRFGK